MYDNSRIRILSDLSLPVKNFILKLSLFSKNKAKEYRRKKKDNRHTERRRCLVVVPVFPIFFYLSSVFIIEKSRLIYQEFTHDLIADRIQTQIVFFKKKIVIKRQAIKKMRLFMSWLTRNTIVFLPSYQIITQNLNLISIIT